MNTVCGPRPSASVVALYDRLAPIYDVIYGIGLQHGRTRAMARLAPRRDETICEVGVGTGLSALRYPEGCRVVGLDLSLAMLARARALLARRGVRHVAFCQMDAARLAFGDGSFDAVYAPYVMNVVDDPLRVAAELKRICRRGGRLVLLNHFARADAAPGVAERGLGWMAARLGGVDWSIDLDGFVRDAKLVVRSIEAVNCGLSSVVVCDNT
jgi:phosphatidylethanolamine/phosphatidyl-N-methylethanolamine N-methyltransferase